MDTWTKHEGDLYHHGTLIRKDYCRHYMSITTGQELRATLRAGEYAWPGGYQLAFFTSDCELLCWNCVRENLFLITWSIRNKVNDGWHVDGTTLLDDLEEPRWCAQCNKQLSGEEDEN